MLADDVHTITLDSATYLSQGLCQGYKARRSIHQDRAITSSLQCRVELDAAVGGLQLDDTVTFENPTHGHSVSLMMPYTLPDRMELLGYLSEYFCLYDDEEDYSQISAISAADRKLAQKKLLKNLLGRFLSVDRKQGAAILEAFTSYKVMAEALDKNQVFENIQQYIDYRFRDYGSHFILACTLFGADIDPLTEAETELVDPFIQLGFRHISLLNDYYSFDIEYASTEDKERLVNGVYILSKLNNISIDQAKHQLKQIAAGLDQDFRQQWIHAMAGGKLSERLQKVVTVIASQMIGNMVWASSCLRYDLQFRLANRETRKRADSHADQQVTLSPVLPERLRSDSILGEVAKDSHTVTITAIELTTA